MSVLDDVLPLPAAKDHLLIEQDDVQHDEALPGYILAAVHRVVRHLGRPITSVAAAVVSDEAGLARASEVLAVKMVLGDYWELQIFAGGSSYAAAAGGAMDVGPAGAAAIGVRLADLLGPAGSTSGAAAGLMPAAAFPAADGWPDPAVTAVCG